MKYPRLIVVVIVLFAGVLILRWSLGSSRNNNERPRPSKPDERASVSQQADGGTSTSIRSNGSSTALGTTNFLTASQLAQTNATPETIANARRMHDELSQKKVDAWATSKNVPVLFWGKVVDQHGSPIENVSITGTVREWYSLLVTAEGKFKPFATKTDPAGMFHIEGGRGDILTIKSLTKPGYELKSRERLSFGYTGSSGFRPDPDNPFTFQLWKQAGAEPIVEYEINRRVPINGAAVAVNLTDYRRQGPDKEKSDIQVAVIRGELQSVGGKMKYDWGFAVDGIAGGVQIANDGFMNLAPASGYSNRVDFIALAADPGWTNKRRERFYLQSRNGQNYGSLEIEVYMSPDSSTCRLEILSRINPSGSRVLERSSFKIINNIRSYREPGY